MDIPEQLITEIAGLRKRRYIKKPIQTFINDNLEFMQDHVNDEENKCIVLMLDVISGNIISAEDRKNYNRVCKSIIDIIKKYQDKFNEPSIEVNSIPNKIEDTLDGTIPKYYVYDEKYPMKGITFNESKHKYKIKFGDIDAYSVDLPTACKQIMENYGLEKSAILGKKTIKKSFTFNDRSFIFYWKTNEPYFDIQHIISVLNLKKSSWNDKYREFKNEIIFYKWHKNIYGGYILRELINETTMYNLFLSSNGDLSQQFRDKVSKIVTELRKNGQMEITPGSAKKNNKPIDEDNNRFVDNKSIDNKSIDNKLIDDESLNEPFDEKNHAITNKVNDESFDDPFDESIVSTEGELQIARRNKYQESIVKNQPLQIFVDDRMYFDHLINNKNSNAIELAKIQYVDSKNKDIEVETIKLESEKIKFESLKLQLEIAKINNHLN